MATAPASTPKKKPSNSNRRNVWLLVLTTFLVVVSVFLFTPPQERINQGLDIQGGLSVVLTAKTTDGAAPTTDEMEKSRAIIESRVNALGASEAVVQLQGTDQILVQIPGLRDTEEALNTIGKTGKLEFARLDSFTDEAVVEKINSGQFGSEGTITDNFGNTLPSGTTEHLKVEPGTYTPLITGENITRVTVDRAGEMSTDYAVNLKLDSAGTEAFAQATKDLAPTKGKIVIILDNEVQSAPAVQSEILTGDVSITGGYTETEAKALQTVLESGSLPVSFEYAQSQVVGPTLGQEALTSGVIVAGIGLLIVMIYLLIFYSGLGLITAGAMAVFAILYLGLLALLSRFGLFSLSLAGVAGIVLTIGMAADSSILTLERFREEIRMGRSVRAASITGVKHAIWTSIDADSVTLVSALALFFLASASVKGFGLTLALGIICDIVMMLVFKAPLIRLLAPKIIAKNPGFWGIKDCIEAAEYRDELAKADQLTAAQKADAALKPTEKPKLKGRFIKRDINFLGYRKIFLGVSAVLVVAAFAIVGIRGLNFGIEFVGGSSVNFENTGAITTEQMRSAFTAAGEPDAVIQTTETMNKPGFLVRIANDDAEQVNALAGDVAENLGLSDTSYQVTTIGPDWGASVIRSSLIAFLVSLVLIIIYIGIRFEYKMGIIAVITLLHDLILVIGIYALVGREVNPNTIAALLTILGYSLYDTVVVFHRIADNMKEEGIRCTFMTMANHSVNQVLLRTINTTMTSLIPVVAMLFFGGETLKDFAFAMVIGLVVGSYSSIAVATPLFSIWKTREKRYSKLVQKFGDGIDLFSFGQPIESVSLTEAKKAAQRAASGQTLAVATAGAGDGGAQASDVGGDPTDATSVAQAAVQAAKAERAKQKQQPKKLSKNPRKNIKNKE